MAKIILTKDGKILQEIPLMKERTNIGRRPHNDVVIEDVAISAEHVAIHTSINEPVLEDLNSTNGTLVNGQPKKIYTFYRIGMSSSWRNTDCSFWQSLIFVKTACI